MSAKQTITKTTKVTRTKSRKSSGNSSGSKRCPTCGKFMK